jgi:hypothetical protein
LNLKNGMKVRVADKRADVDLGDIPVTSSARAPGVIVFIKRFANIDTTCGPAVDAAKEDCIAWIMYPKAG